MPFLAIDDEAYGDDQPLDTFLLKRQRSNLQATRDLHPAIATWCMGTFDTSSGAALLPEISSYRSPGWLPCARYVSPGDRQVTVEVYEQVATNVSSGGTEVFLSAAAWTLADWINPSGRPFTTVIDTIAGAMGAAALHTLAVPLTALRSPGWIVIAVGWQSAAGAAVEIQDAGGDGPPAFTGWYPAYFIGHDDASADLGSGSGISHWALRVRDTTAKASDAVPSLDQGRQLLYLLDRGSPEGARRYYLYVYPAIREPWSDEGSALAARHVPSADSLWYEPLGVAVVHSVTLYTSDPGDLADPRARTDATQAAGARFIRPEAREPIEHWLTRTRVHCMGQQPNTATSMLDFTGTGPSDRLGLHLHLTKTATALARCVVGSDSAFNRGATSYTRRCVEICALLLFTHVGPDIRTPQRFIVQWDAHFTDLDGVTDPYTVDGPEVEVVAMPRPASLGGANATAGGNLDVANEMLGAQLVGFSAGTSSPNTLYRHPLRGLWPESARRDAFWTPCILRARDPFDGADRLLTLRVKGVWDADAAPTTAEGVTMDYRPWVHLASWTVITAPWPDRAPSPAEM